MLNTFVHITLNIFVLIFQNTNRISSPQQIVEKALKSNRVDLNSSQQEILKRFAQHENKSPKSIRTIQLTFYLLFVFS